MYEEGLVSLILVSPSGVLNHRKLDPQERPVLISEASCFINFPCLEIFRGWSPNVAITTGRQVCLEEMKAEIKVEAQGNRQLK